MPKITKLERQKHKKDRVSVFVDDEYAFSLSDELIIEYSLTAGMDVNGLPLKEIADADEYKRGISAAFKHMSVSEKSEQQLRDFLFKKEISQKNIERILARLKSLNYIDDLAYAENFVEHSSSGKRALRFKLKEKGISDEIINTVLDNVTDEAQLEKALDLVRRQLPRYAEYSIFEQKKKINDFLVRRGFDWDTVSLAVEKCFEQQEAD